MKERLVNVQGRNYLVREEKPKIGELVTDLNRVYKFEGNTSYKGLFRIVSSEEDLGFVEVKETPKRLFDLCPQEKDLVPVTKSWLQAIINRGGACSATKTFKGKLVLQF